MKTEHGKALPFVVSYNFRLDLLHIEERAEAEAQNTDNGSPAAQANRTTLVTIAGFMAAAVPKPNAGE